MSSSARSLPWCSLSVALSLVLGGCDVLGGAKEAEAGPTESTPRAETPSAPATPTKHASKPKPKPKPEPEPEPEPKPAPTPALKSTQEIIELAKAAGDDRTQLEAAIAHLDARLSAKESIEDHYLRAQILDRMQRHEDALVALQSTLRLDPHHSDAHHLAGIIVAGLGRDDEAMEHWTAAALGTPPHPDSAYNAGQYLYNAKRYEEALQMWQIALQARRDDFAAAKKIVQALNALGRHDDAEKAKEEAKRIFASSTDPGVKKQDGFVIDQVLIEGHQVMIHETITTPDRGLYYHWTAVVLAADGKTRILSVQLESSDYGRETGVPFISGVTRGKSHSTWGGGYKALPTYAAWRAAAIEKITQELRA
jgi:tetratricopeptide (TPR) repeat protein